MNWYSIMRFILDMAIIYLIICKMAEQFKEK